MSEETIINNVYNVANIICNNNIGQKFLGGICGYGNIYQYADNFYLKNAYNAGKIEVVADDSSYVGSLCGYMGGRAIIENCYYIQDSQYKGIGYDGSSMGEIIDFTNVDKQMLVEKLNKDTDVWAYDANNINNGYPIFIWQ